MKRVLVSITFRREDGHICSAEKKKKVDAGIQKCMDLILCRCLSVRTRFFQLVRMKKTATYHYPEQLQILVYPLEEDKIAECIVPDEKGNEVLDITARYKDEKIVLCSSGENEEITYLLVNVHDVKEVCGAEWKNTERGTVIYPKCDIVEIVFRK